MAQRKLAVNIETPTPNFRRPSFQKTCILLRVPAKGLRSATCRSLCPVNYAKLPNEERAAGKLYGVPESILRGWMKGSIPRRGAHFSQQLLRWEQKDVLAQWCRFLGQQAEPLSKKGIKQKVHERLIASSEAGEISGIIFPHFQHG
ncbi:hypothetical protein M422DRAFT_253029 [Sphaerobolus stellatus SS14]|uniref:HTH CENPB-type domain-containing protein n=1 Tax=Sphaerobolus stellatus (strain SS14) TaxID=990650 RepID=A0A0C9VNY8_SPHS4|nr:hypothetical protein M422DRAFT_253029 [Sphaerobolus stellatus SS14]